MTVPTDVHTAAGEGDHGRTMARPWQWMAVSLVAALVGAALAVTLLVPSTPGDESAEAGFARDMSTHHAQAVEMAGLLQERTTDEELLVLAEDITLSQQAQIGQMSGWLDLWGLPAASTAPPMAWAYMGSMPMMGMATSGMLQELRRADGVAAETLFLDLMIEHHRGGVQMSEALLDRSDHAVVSRLAEAIIRSQSSEIQLMERLLAERS